MRQFVGGIRDSLGGSGPWGPGASPGGSRVSPRAGTVTVRDLLLSIAGPRVREAASRLDAAELAMMERDDEPTQIRYAAALAEWGDAGGYPAQVHWDSCCTAPLPAASAPCPCPRLHPL